MVPEIDFGANEAARNALRIPSILILASAGVSLLWTLYGIASPTDPAEFEAIYSGFAGAGLPPETMNQIHDLISRFFVGTTWFFSLLGLATSGLAIFGGLKMYRAQSYRWAIVAALASILPCTCCFCFSTVGGIWALVLLSRPEIKAAFV